MEQIQNASSIRKITFAPVIKKAMAELKILLNIYLEFVSEISLHIPHSIGKKINYIETIMYINPVQVTCIHNHNIYL